jgi:hypothetical protein
VKVSQALRELLELLELELLLSAFAADGNADDTCVGNLALFLPWASEAALEAEARCEARCEARGAALKGVLEGEGAGVADGVVQRNKVFAGFEVCDYIGANCIGGDVVKTIASSSASEHVVAVFAGDEVITGAATNHIIAGSSYKHVVAVVAA